MSNDSDVDYHILREHDDKANALRQRQLEDQQTFTRLENRTDYVVQPGIIGTRSQAIGRSPMPDIQRISAGQQIVQNPTLLRQAIMPQTRMAAVPRPVAVSTKPYVQKIHKPPMVNTPSILYTGGMPTGMPVKKWPTSFKKAFHKVTSDEAIMKGVTNLDHMSRNLFGRGSAK